MFKKIFAFATFSLIGLSVQAMNEPIPFFDVSLLKDIETKEEFEALVKSPKPTIINFYSTTAGITTNKIPLRHTRIMHEILTQLNRNLLPNDGYPRKEYQYAAATVAVVNVDKIPVSPNSMVGGIYGQSQALTAIYQNGEIVDQIIGFIDLETLKRRLDLILAIK